MLAMSCGRSRRIGTMIFGGCYEEFLQDFRGLYWPVDCYGQLVSLSADRVGGGRFSWSVLGQLDGGGEGHHAGEKAQRKVRCPSDCVGGGSEAENPSWVNALSTGFAEAS